MKESIIKNILANKEIVRSMKKLAYYDEENYYSDAIRYVKAIRERRVVCNIDTVSKSGMSRTIKFVELDKPNDGHNEFFVRNFYGFFIANGFERSRNEGYFRIHGCGMDMIFHTNYTIIHTLNHLGFINDEECRSLAQKTPHVI